MRKGSSQIVVAILIIFFLLVATGYINLDKIQEFIFGKQHKFLISVNTTTPTIREGQSITFSVIVFNPLNSEYEILNPYLDIDYNKTAFSTRNYDLKYDRRISLNPLKQGEKTVYYIEFDSFYYRSKGNQAFVFYVYDSQYLGNLLDSREVVINVR
jgi:hypothetical protein